MRILLSSVFKPFGFDDCYGRKESKPELYHNQLTLAQGVFSIRNFTTTYGLHTIANNIEVPTTVLDFPKLNRFRKEVLKGYDIVGIGAIPQNFQRLRKMAQVTRELAPRSKLIIGGFCSAIPGIKELVDCDEVCVGEGISFMRSMLGLPAEYEFRNADGVFAETKEIFGVPLRGFRKPLMVVGLGCSYGCDFCSPSHFYGKKRINLMKSGRAIFDELMRLYQRYPGESVTFIGDDNFLDDRDRAEEFRQCVMKSGRMVRISIFGTADRAMEFGPEGLAEMGVDMIWMGREGMFTDYKKNTSVDYKSLVPELRRYGIKPTVSSILLLDQHNKENIRADIQDHIECAPVFSQFIYYSPLCGTPLYARMEREGRIIQEMQHEDRHGLTYPWITHPEFTQQEARAVRDYAYQHEYQELGPSVMRLIDTEYQGWFNLKDSPNPILRIRAEAYAKDMSRNRILLLATEHLAPTDRMVEMARDIRGRIEASFGKATAFERAAARCLHLAGAVREVRTRWWGDVIQPTTYVTHYNV